MRRGAGAGSTSASVGHSHRRRDRVAEVLLVVPDDELFAAATRVRNEALLLSLVLIVVWIPLTVWVASFVARPLSALRAEAIALRNRDFNDRGTTSSIISEIHEFASTFDSMRLHISEHNAAATRFIPQEFLRLLERADITRSSWATTSLREMTILLFGHPLRSFWALSSESMIAAADVQLRQLVPDPRRI